MKSHVRQLAGQQPDALTRMLVVREYLQARILQSLQDRGAFLRWAFLGGTALRFLYGMPRFSEDLDFSAIRTTGTEAGATTHKTGTPITDAAFRPTVLEVRRALVAEGYHVETSIKDEQTVAAAFLEFPGLLHELGLSPRTTQALSIKVEVDTNPPSGAGIETTIVRRHVTLNLCHHDKPSLLAGKLHAILSRRWTKGRDLFDLAWYLADRAWPPPNVAMLNAALAQTGWAGPLLSIDNWKQEVRTRLAAIDWTQAQADVRPFLEHERDVALVSRDALEGLL